MNAKYYSIYLDNFAFFIIVNKKVSLIKQRQQQLAKDKLSPQITIFKTSFIKLYKDDPRSAVLIIKFSLN